MLGRGDAKARTARGQQDLSAALELEAEWKGFLSAIVARWDGNGSVRKQDRSRRREQEIMRAALRVFARDGLSRSRIQDVAAEAGMPVSTLYEYCASKEELAYLVPMASLSQFYAEYAEGVEREKTARARLRLYMCMAGDFARRNPEWARVLYLEIWPSVLIGGSPLRSCIDDYVHIILFLIRQGERLGEWESGPDPYETAAILNGSVNQVIITSLLYRQPRNLTKATESIVDRTMTLLKPPSVGAPTRGRHRRARRAASATASSPPT
jgi:AcrR family transcriptional regulator